MRTLLAICAVALPIPAAIAGCGGDDDSGSSDADPQEVLDATFGNDERISSGNLDLSASISAEGDQAGSFDASLSGPFQGDPDNPNALPQLDLTASASGEGGGQSIDFEGGLVVTDDNAFVEYGGQSYEVGSDTFAQAKDQLEAQAGKTDQSVGFSEAFKQGCEQSVEQQGGDPSACDFDVASWLTDLSNDGTEDVEGTDTNHISGSADVEQILTDIGGIAASFPGAESSGVDLTKLGQFAPAVDEATIDVYSGVDDNLLRKLDFNLSIDPSAIAAGAAVPVDSINVTFSVTIGAVNEDQTIEAPSGAKPIDDLLSQFGLSGGLGDLGALGGLGGSSLPITPGGTSGGGNAASGAAAQDYLDCVSQAKSADEQTACLNELSK
jgi:hypothetical protein